MSLDDIRIKLDRAKEHAETFKAEVDRFAAKGNPLHVVRNEWFSDLDRVEWAKEPPKRWGAIVGDCVHNLRATLDHIAWDLAGEGDYMGPAVDPPDHTEFPIFKDETKYLKRTNKGQPARGSGLSKIEGIRDTNPRTVIRTLQPFRGPDPLRHPLWILHELDRLDKHRTLHAVWGWGHTNASMLDRGMKIIEVSDLPEGWRRTTATQSSRHLANIRSGDRDQVKMRFDLALYVSLPPQTVGSHENLDVVLAKLIGFVENEVLDRLRPWLSLP